MITKIGGKKIGQLDIEKRFQYHDFTSTDFLYQADRSLATRQLEGCKKAKERLTFVVCANGDDFDKVPLWVIGNTKTLVALKTSIAIILDAIIGPVQKHG